jgi:hypothetical protein
MILPSQGCCKVFFAAFVGGGRGKCEGSLRSARGLDTALIVNPSVNARIIWLFTVLGVLIAFPVLVAVRSTGLVLWQLMERNRTVVWK